MVLVGDGGGEGAPQTVSALSELVELEDVADGSRNDTILTLEIFDFVV